jgi:hypothetical protein
LKAFCRSPRFPKGTQAVEIDGQNDFFMPWGEPGNVGPSPDRDAELSGENPQSFRNFSARGKQALDIPDPSRGSERGDWPRLIYMHFYCSFVFVTNKILVSLTHMSNSGEIS